MEKYSLPFDAKFQSGLLYLLITDYEFLRSVIDDLEPGHFDAGESHVKLFKLVKKVFMASKKPITMGIINNYILKLKESNFYSEGDVFGLHAVIDAGNSLIPVELAYVKDNCIDFLKKQSMAIAFSKALDSFEKADYDSLYSQIGEAYKKSYTIGTDFGLDYSKQLVTDRYSVPPRSGIWSTGFPTFDGYIGGGFAKKESHSFISATGRGKCLGINTPILMSDGTIKMVQDIVVGDKLMGPDGKSRNVLSTTSGKSDLYKITPVKGDPYIVNDVHLLSLKVTGNSNNINLVNGNKVINNQKEPIFIEAQDFYKESKTAKHCLKGWRPEAVSFEKEYTNHIIPPYILGVWLGDGTSTKPNITQMNNEVVTEYTQYANSINCSIVEHPDKRSEASDWSLVSNLTTHQSNTFLVGLQQLNLINNKHIPTSYKMSSIKDRLELLAGLLDTDGSLHYDGYDFTQKNKSIAEDVVFIARSLGLAAYMSECTKSIKATGFSGQYWRVTISGDCSIIPVRLTYKKASIRQQKKDVLRTGISIEKAGYGEYYGFEIDGDKQFLLGDWQVTHNTALLCNLAVSALKQRKKTLFITLEMSKEQIAQRFDSIISGFSAGELATMPEARIELQRNLNQRLHGLTPIIKEFNRGQLSVNGLRNYLDKYIMEYGNPDVVILDWLGCMKMPTGIDKKHEAVGQVADEIINMSREYNCTIINAQQSNRSAVGNDSFGYDSVSSSFESLFGQDGVYTLGASDKAKDAGRRTLTIAKNRNGPDSVFVSLQGDLPTKPLTFKFRECILEEEESTLLKEPGSTYKKKENKD
jgi:replicative DNA helicase